MVISLASCAINAERFDAADFDAGTLRFFATYRGRSLGSIRFLVPVSAPSRLVSTDSDLGCVRSVMFGISVYHRCVLLHHTPGEHKVSAKKGRTTLWQITP